MKTRTYTRLLVLLLVVVLALSGLVISGAGAVTARAASGDALQSFLVEVKWSGWSSGSSKTFMNGMTHEIITGWNIHCSYDNQDIANCKVCYCIEPGVHTSSGLGYTEKDELWFRENLNNFNDTIDGLTVRQLLGRIMQYGYVGGVDFGWGTNPSAYRSQICQYIATQLLVWEVIVGERNENFSWVPPSAGYDMVYSLIDNHPWRQDIVKAYQDIERSMKTHVSSPSFLADKASDAQTVALKWDGSKYTATLTDTNNVLSSFKFTASGGVTCTVSGNTLTLSSATAPSGPVTVTGTKTTKRKGLVVWYRDDYQKKISYTQEVDDPLWGYMRVEAEQMGKAQIVKNTTNGGSKTGWHFTVKGSSGSTIGSYVTNSTGIITLDLAPGTYTVTETDGPYNYWVNDPQPTKTVTVVAGQTATVTFLNKWNGKAKIVKDTTNGGDKFGWAFGIYTDAECTDRYGPYHYTDSNGVITVDLEPGTYYVKEIGNQEIAQEDDEYWVYDDSIQKVTVKAGQTASVTFTNKWNGKVQIEKGINDGGAEALNALFNRTLEGWEFELEDEDGNVFGPYTTDVNGKILVDLEPGTYYVTELLDETSPWFCEGNMTQKVTVKAGQTARVYYANALKPGTLKLHKLGGDGTALAGAKFLLEYSYDGTNWERVWWNDEYVPGEGGWIHPGGCSNEEVDGTGCLTTDANGVAVFDGLWPTLYYRLTEVATPNGYQLSHGVVFEGTLATAPDFTVTLEATNDLVVLPMTGSYDFWLLPAAVVGALCSVWLLVTSRRRKTH